MADRSGDSWLRSLLHRFRSAPREPEPGDDATLDRATQRIGPYRVIEKLGQGGMGIVFSALDERLDRSLAIKVIRGEVAGDSAARRFWREARAAAAVNHPNICQVYEVGEHDGQLFIAMELLEGESLDERLERGALPVNEAVPVALGILSALDALHGRGLVHRDLKPSNVFLTEHGVKLLDFGLARPVTASDAAEDASGDLTRPGVLVGTPRYMAPEQVDGTELGPATDVFAAGALLFEMLAGRPAFEGQGLVQVLHGVLHEQPPALAGSADVVASDRVIRRALEKVPGRRYPTAKAMAAELRSITLGSGTSAPTLTLKRLVVLPFRTLRPDPDTDFLSYGLADGLSTSLAGFRSLVVRSTAAAARLAEEPLDLKRIATEADVDLVVTGSVLRAGDRLRVTVQVVEAHSGTIVGSHTLEPEMGDVIRLQDDVTRSIVEFLSPTLSGRAGSARRNVAATAAAQELYLRAAQAAQNYERFVEARDLYESCVEKDPDFAPAWAQLGRCDRLIGKYMGDRRASQEQAEASFKRALEIDPDLPIAHKHYAQLEAETGRATAAMNRLIRAADASPNDAEVFAGLVHACRYAGLLEASLAAHEEARRLDPHIATGFEWTLLARVEYERLATLAVEKADQLYGAPQILAMSVLGRADEARPHLKRHEERGMPEVLRVVTGWVRPFLDQDGQGIRDAVERAVEAFYDPEALFIYSLVLFHAGHAQRGLELLDGAVTGGYNAVTALADEPSFDPVRGQPVFEALRRTANERRAEALAAYRSAGGERLLGI